MDKPIVSSDEKIAVVVGALSEAGYDTYSQLYGFLETGDATYITRRRDARSLVQSIDKEQLRTYIDKLKHSNTKHRSKMNYQ